MKLRFGFRIFLPILILALVALIACIQDGDETPAPQGLLPTQSPVEPTRPLTDAERATIDEFAGQQQSIGEEREQFYQEFDDWQANLTACHPSTARESLRDFAVSFGTITDSARYLPRTTSTKDLADLLITAANAEETAFRQLRDRWQPGNLSLLEAVELWRAEAGHAQNAVTDLSFQLQEEFEEGPTADEVEEMEGFSDTFDGIADAWDDFHDDYAAFVKRERRLEDDAIIAGYEQLIEQFKEILSTIEELTPTEINEELIETLQDAAEAELAALEYLLETLMEALPEPSDSSDSKDASATLPTSAAATPVSLPAQSPEPPEKSAMGPTQEAPAAVSEEAEEAKEMAPSPEEELAEAVEESEAALVEVEQSIEEIVNDKSAENLEHLKAFGVQYRVFVNEWNQFYEGFSGWRATDGGCDRVEAGMRLTEFSRQAGRLARQVRDLPQSGFLLPVYTLMVEAAEREEGAFRTLASSWTPYAVDVFKAVEEERVASGQLRRQASIALEELRNRP